MEDHQLAKKYIKYNPELKIAVCIHHKYTILPGNEPDGRSRAVRHFQEVHERGSVRKNALNAINEYMSTLELVEPSQIDIPLPENGPIDGLELYKDGGACLYPECGELSPRSKDIRTHCRLIHKSEPIEGLIWKRQAVQTIFSGSNSKYIISFFAY